MHNGNQRYRQAGHFAKIAGDCLGLAALFRVDSRVGAGSVEKRDDRPSEFGRQLHCAQRFTVAFGLGHAKVAVKLLFRVPALLFADQQDRLPFEPRQTTHDCRVVPEEAITVDFLKVRQDALHIVERVRAFRMTGVLDSLPGSFLPEGSPVSASNCIPSSILNSGHTLP